MIVDSHPPRPPSGSQTPGPPSGKLELAKSKSTSVAKSPPGKLEVSKTSKSTSVANQPSGKLEMAQNSKSTNVANRSSAQADVTSTPISFGDRVFGSALSSGTMGFMSLRPNAPRPLQQKAAALKPSFTDSAPPTAKVWASPATENQLETKSSGNTITGPTPAEASSSSSLKRPNIEYRGAADHKKKRTWIPFTLQQKDDRKEKSEKKKADAGAAYTAKIINWYENPVEHRGEDSPTGNFTSWNKFKPAMIVTKGNLTPNFRNTAIANFFTLMTNYKMKYSVRHSQNLALHFKDDSQADFDTPSSNILINMERIRNWRRPEDLTKIGTFFRKQLETHEVTVENVIQVFDNLNMTGLTKEDAQAIVNFGKPAGATNIDDFGLDFLGFRVSNSNSNYWHSGYQLTQIMRDQAPYTCVVRQKHKINDMVEEFFNQGWNKMEEVQMIYPAYGQIMKEPKSGEKRFMPWLEMLNAEKTPNHMPWMETEKRGIFARQPLIEVFYDRKAHRDVFSAAVIFDHYAHENALSSSTGPGVLHDARVLETRIETAKVVLDVTLNREETAMVPKFALNATFNVTISDIFDNVSDVEMTSKGAPISATQATQAPTLTNFTATLHKGKCSGDFMMIFTIEAHHVLQLEEGKTKKISFTCPQNTAPARRQLEALELFNRKIKRGDRGYDLQHILLGLPYADTERQRPFLNRQLANDKLLYIVDEYRKSLGMNEKQNLFLDSVIYDPVPLQKLLGPPGCGKTKALAGATGLLNILDKHVLATAPTKTASEQFFGHCLDANEMAKAVVGQNNHSEYKDTKVIHFPTMLSTIESIWSGNLDRGTLAEAFMEMTKNDSFNPSISSEARRQAQHMVDLVESNSRNENQYAVDEDNVKTYIKANWRRVFDESDSMLTVVSTCSNAHLLRANCHSWKPDWVCVDEAASAVEPDVIIVFIQGAKKGAIAGDSWQLAPVVTNSSASEFSPQMQVSIFRRLELAGSSMQTLDVNYRMHPRISQLPGMITYGWLGNGINTYMDSEDFKGVQEFWESTDAAELRLRRREPIDSRFKNGDCRRLMFNTKGSRSAPAPGSKSLRNFGNINAIVDIINRLTNHKGVYKINLDRITVLSPYKDQKREIEIQLRCRLKLKFKYLEIIDSMQGGQNDIILLDITPANEIHGSKIGFLRDWNRMNVALTRAKSILWIFGNFDAWNSEIRLFYATETAKGKTSKPKWSMFLSDLLLRGDIVDFYTQPTREHMNHLTVEFDSHGNSLKTLEIEHLNPENEAPLTKAAQIAFESNNSKNRRIAQMKYLEMLQNMLSKWEPIDEAFKAANNIPGLFEDIKKRQVKDHQDRLDAYNKELEIIALTHSLELSPTDKGKGKAVSDEDTSGSMELDESLVEDIELEPGGVIPCGDDEDSGEASEDDEMK